MTEIGLLWRIFDDDGTQLGTVTYNSDGIGAPVIIGGVFTVEQLQPQSPVVSNISFTVQSSINGYTIVCQDIFNIIIDNIINIPGMNALLNFWKL